MPAQATAREHHASTDDDAGSGVDVADYRRVLGHFPSGVTVVASEDADGPVGFACQAFPALSLDPPLVLFSVGHTSTTWPRIQATGRFCVNFLAADHEELCRAFAVSGGDKFAGVAWRRSELGSPILAGAHGWVDCTIEATLPRRRPHDRDRPRARARRRRRVDPADLPQGCLRLTGPAGTDPPTADG